MLKSLDRIVIGIARWLAIVGGVVLVAVTLTIVASISGRALIWAGLRPIPGDFELLEAGVGFAIFAFLPWCQINRGHAMVDVFTIFFSDQVNRSIDLFSEVLLTLAIALITWRLWFGLQDKINYRETTFILQFPMSWPYMACFAAACIAVIVSIYMVGVRFNEVRTGRGKVDSGHGAIH